jgi:outer membrane protein OmpA-like peptidoglycan-associated protein
LSEERAAAVKNWLEGKGIEASRLKTAGFGDARPIDSNKTPEGRANNRRVEFVKF